MMLQACLGVEVDGRRGEVRIDRPSLPDGVDRLTLHKLDVGAETIDLGFERIGSRTVAFRAGGSAHVRIVAKV